MLLALLTFAICEVAYAEDVVGVRVVVLFDVGRFLRGVLQLHGHFLQLLVQLKTKKRLLCHFLSWWAFIRRTIVSSDLCYPHAEPVVVGLKPVQP